MNRCQCALTNDRTFDPPRDACKNFLDHRSVQSVGGSFSRTGAKPNRSTVAAIEVPTGNKSGKRQCWYDCIWIAYQNCAFFSSQEPFPWCKTWSFVSCGDPLPTAPFSMVMSWRRCFLNFDWNQNVNAIILVCFIKRDTLLRVSVAEATMNGPCSCDRSALHFLHICYVIKLAGMK